MDLKESLIRCKNCSNEKILFFDVDLAGFGVKDLGYISFMINTKTYFFNVKDVPIGFADPSKDPMTCRVMLTLDYFDMQGVNRVQFETEKEMIAAFLDIVFSENPTLIVTYSKSDQQALSDRLPPVTGILDNCVILYPVVTYVYNRTGRRMSSYGVNSVADAMKIPRNVLPIRKIWRIFINVFVLLNKW